MANEVSISRAKLIESLNKKMSIASIAKEFNVPPKKMKELIETGGLAHLVQSKRGVHKSYKIVNDTPDQVPTSTPMVEELIEM